DDPPEQLFSRPEAAVSARADRPFEPSTEPVVGLGDALDRVLEPALHVDPGALGGPADPARRAAEADRTGELTGLRVPLLDERVRPVGIAAGLGGGDRVGEVVEALLVRAARLGVERGLVGAIVERRAGLVAREREHVDLLAGTFDQAREELHAARVLDPQR